MVVFSRTLRPLSFPFSFLFVFLFSFFLCFRFSRRVRFRDTGQAILSVAAEGATCARAVRLAACFPCFMRARDPCALTLFPPLQRAWIA